MLVATPNVPSLADRKPRVISEIRKVNVQRSPSLDGHPKLSGILNYYSECLRIWTQRTVAVRDGSLLVYGPDCTPYDYTPARSYASLGRTPTPRRLHYSNSKSNSEIQTDQINGYSTPNHGYLENKTTIPGSNSLGRLNGTLCGGAEFRLPLRHLNLMPSTLGARAFSLSYRQDGNGAVPVATFQALSQLEYERWVKTLAVEIMRQTPLEAIRFLDVLGIAAFATPSESIENKKQPESKIANGSENRRASSHDPTFRWDRSPSSEGSTTSTDFIAIRNSEGETPLSTKKYGIANQSVVRRKLHMSDVESQSDRDEVDALKTNTEIKQNSTGRKSRDKLRRSRDIFANGSSSEDTRALDEGIVIEERGSSSDRSCRRALWSSDRSDFLDSPHSISSFSSYERCDSPDALDVVDNVSHHFNKSFTKCDAIYDKRFAPIKYNSLPAEISTILPNLHERVIINVTPQKETAKIKIKSPMMLYRAQPFINEPSPEPERCTKKVEFNKENSAKTLTPLILVNTAPQWTPDYLKVPKCWSRARSCSPNNNSRSAPRFASSGRGFRALSAGQDNLSVPEDGDISVEMLRQRCQNTENYVPVKEKLALFESLCRNGRLARSSEELAAIERSSSTAPRARSLHDLSRSRSPQVPVREMCKFFEKISNVTKIVKKETKPNNGSTKTSHLYEKFTSKSSSGDKYLKHKRNDCSNINKDSVFDKTVHKAKHGLDCNKNLLNYGIGVKFKDKMAADFENERSNYENFTQIRQGNKIITYV